MTVTNSVTKKVPETSEKIAAAPENVTVSHGAVTAKPRFGICPHCGQSMGEYRLDVRLPPMKRRIFDLIQRRPGITGKELAEIVYGRSDRDALCAARVNVSQLRDLLVGIGVKIRGRQGYGYWLEDEGDE